MVNNEISMVTDPPLDCPTLALDKSFFTALIVEKAENVTVSELCIQLAIQVYVPI